MLTEPAAKDPSPLALAVDELIKTTLTHVGSASLSTGNAASLKTSLDSKLNTLDQSISNLKEEVAKMNSAMANQAKNQRLEWAISNAGINSFKHHEKGGFSLVESTAIVQSVLLSFKKGPGHYITDRSMTGYRYGQNAEEGEKQFRDALSNQIHALTGQKPRIALADNGYAIYYS